MKKTRVMIVDDQFISRKFFEMYIEPSDRYEVAYSVESAAFADTYVLKNNIDLVIMDILMNDGTNGLRAAERIKKNSPDTRVIAVTSMPEPSWLGRARSIGVDSFWYKEASKETIINVMDRTMMGESVYPDSAPETNIGIARSSEMTERELEVLKLMTTGIPNAAIAEKLEISENTVKNHIHNMLEKTGCSNRTELAIEARVNGIAVKID
ncbi:MAG: response regulator transcription factor [Bacillota bacterium]|nr:response regulator transcription factor [Bacillota bacterium]